MHQFVDFTVLEKNTIDSAFFQRLRRIKRRGDFSEIEGSKEKAF